MKKSTPQAKRKRLFTRLWSHYVGSTRNVKYIEQSPLVGRSGKTRMGYADRNSSSGLYVVGLDYMAEDPLHVMLHEIAHIKLGHLDDNHRAAGRREIPSGELAPLVEQMRELTDAVRSNTQEAAAEKWAKRERARWA